MPRWSPVIAEDNHYDHGRSGCLHHMAAFSFAPSRPRRTITRAPTPPRHASSSSTRACPTCPASSSSRAGTPSYARPPSRRPAVSPTGRPPPTAQARAARASRSAAPSASLPCPRQAVPSHFHLRRRARRRSQPKAARRGRTTARRRTGSPRRRSRSSRD